MCVRERARAREREREREREGRVSEGITEPRVRETELQESCKRP